MFLSFHLLASGRQIICWFGSDVTLQAWFELWTKETCLTLMKLWRWYLVLRLDQIYSFIMNRVSVEALYGRQLSYRIMKVIDIFNCIIINCNWNMEVEISRPVIVQLVMGEVRFAWVFRMTLFRIWIVAVSVFFLGLQFIGRVEGVCALHRKLLLLMRLILTVL